MEHTYTQSWASYQPGCMIFLLDQSGSMAEKFGYMQAGTNKRNAMPLPQFLNSFLNELVLTNTIPRADGTPDVRPRADICVLGYEGNTIDPILTGLLTGKEFVTLPELQLNPSDIEMRKKKEMDDTGAEFEVQVPFPIWVRPKAGGGTPMCAALRRARDLAAQ